MRYQLINTHQIESIKIVRHNGMLTVNPPDSLVDQLEIGYTYTPVNSPGVGDFDPMYTHSYALQNNVITDVWTLP